MMNENDLADIPFVRYGCWVDYVEWMVNMDCSNI